MCDEAPKYGNDDDEVNELTGDMFCFIADYIESFHSKFGKMTPMPSVSVPWFGDTPSANGFQARRPDGSAPTSRPNGDLKRSTEASGGLQRTAGTCSWLYSIFYRAWKRSTGRYHFQNFTFQYLLGKRVKSAVFHKKYGKSATGDVHHARWRAAGKVYLTGGTAYGIKSKYSSD